MGFNGHYHLKVNLLQWPRFYFLVKLHSLTLVAYSFSIKKAQLIYKSSKQNMDNVDLIIKKKSKNEWDIVFPSKSSQQWKIHVCLSVEKLKKYADKRILMKEVL